MSPIFAWEGNVNLQIERLCHLTMYGTECWFICAQTPDMIRSAAAIISEKVYAGLSEREQARIMATKVTFRSGECVTSDPMAAFACMNAKPELGISTVKKWKKTQIPGGPSHWVSPPTNDPDDPFPLEPEPEEPPLVADPIKPEEKPAEETGKVNVRGKAATTTRRRTPRKTK